MCALGSLAALGVVVGVVMVVGAVIVRFMPQYQVSDEALLADRRFIRMTVFVGLVLFGLCLGALVLLPVERCM